MKEHLSLLKAGDYNRIPSVFCAFAYDCHDFKVEVAKALCDVLDKSTFDDLVRIDEQMRQATSMEWSINWRNYTIDDFITSDMSASECRSVTIFASFNPNGYIRERAVQMMKGFYGTLPFVILRQNDWVSQVRVAASEVVDYRLANLSEGELISALPFTDKLSRSERLQDSEIYVNRIYLTLTSLENELIAGLSSKNIRTRRICTKMLFNTLNPRYDLAFDRLVDESDPFLRSKIFRQLLESNQNMDAIVDRFLMDKFLQNRLLAFQYICEHNQETALHIAQNLLIDKNATVRESARYYLKNNRVDIDFRAFYKSHFKDRTVSAILGLGETGIPEDAKEIEDYLSVSQISIVRAAMTAVMRLASTKYVELITEFLADNRVGIVTTAKNLIIKTALIDYSRITEIFYATPYKITKQKCFSILLTTRKWPRLILILDVLESGESEIAESATVALQRWVGNYNRSFVTPNEAQIKQIRESIDRLGNKLPLNMQRQLAFMLK